MCCHGDTVMWYHEAFALCYHVDDIGYHGYAVMWYHCDDMHDHGYVTLWCDGDIMLYRNVIPPRWYMSMCNVETSKCCIIAMALCDITEMICMIMVMLQCDMTLISLCCITNMSLWFHGDVNVIPWRRHYVLWRYQMLYHCYAIMWCHSDVVIWRNGHVTRDITVIRDFISTKIKLHLCVVLIG